MCEVPFAEAPDLLGTVQHPKGYLHCYVTGLPPDKITPMLGVHRIQPDAEIAGGLRFFPAFTVCSKSLLVLARDFGAG